MSRANGRDEVDLDLVWKKIIRAWREGSVLATVGTGSLSPREESEFGLVGDHNYSIFGPPRSTPFPLPN
jgi:calpain-7